MNQINNTEFDVAIIGSGPGGYVSAIRSAQLKLKAVIIEKDKKLGGTCLYRGCIPTKSLLLSANLYEQIKNAEKFGIIPSDVHFDFEKIQNYKNKVVKKLSLGLEHLFKKNGIQVITGLGKIKKNRVLEVVDENGNTSEIKAKNIIIATGSLPRSLGNMNIDRENIITTDEALELKSIPQTMLIIGAGAIGVEFSSIYSAFGTKTTLVEILPHILPFEDEEIAKELHKALIKRGIIIYTKSSVESVTSLKNRCEAKIKLADGKVITANYEKVLVAVGRKPNIEVNEFENIGINTKNGFIEVNQFLETTQNNIYAIGDIVPTPQLAHVASAEGILAIGKIKGLTVKPINYIKIPNCIYSNPEVASIGLSEKSAKDEGYKIKVGKIPFSANSKASILGENEGFIKIVANEKNSEILGIHIIGPNAVELIASAVIALNSGMKAEDLAQTVFAHPTLSESLAETARNIYGFALHI